MALFYLEKKIGYKFFSKPIDIYEVQTCKYYETFMISNVFSKENMTLQDTLKLINDSIRVVVKIAIVVWFS